MEVGIGIGIGIGIGMSRVTGQRMGVRRPVRRPVGHRMQGARPLPEQQCQHQQPGPGRPQAAWGLARAGVHAKVQLQVELQV